MNPHATQCSPDSPIVAGILVGGQSRRMGTCKAVLTWNGQRFVDRALHAAQSVAQEVVLLGRRHAELTGLEKIPFLPDPVPDAGPMAGLCALLEFAKDRWSLLLACDMPLVDRAVLHRLTRQRSPDADAIAFRVDSDAQLVPCCLMVHPRARAAAEVALQGVSRSVRGVLAAVRCTWIAPSAEERFKLTNINTPDDFLKLRAATEPMANLESRVRP